MMKRTLISPVLLFMLAVAFLAVPVSAGLTVAPSAATITMTDGEATYVFTVTDADIAQGDGISIDVFNLLQFIESQDFTDANVLIDDTAADATWTSTVDENYVLTLTSTGGPTSVGETVTVTFTGAANPWYADVGEMWEVALTATRTDDGETADFNFVIEILPAPTFSSAVTNTDGTKVLVTFNKNMAALPAAPAGFTVTVNGAHDVVSGLALNADNKIIELTLTTPVAASTDVVTVTYAPGTVTSADTGVLAAFGPSAVTNNVLLPPIVTGIAPSSGPEAGGTVVTVTGTGFTGATVVNFGANAGTALTVNPAGTQITITSPDGAPHSVVHVTVTTPRGTSATSDADRFTYAPAPSVTGIAPETGINTGSVSVTITGTDFVNGATVKLAKAGQADILATNVVWVSATQITCDFFLTGAAAGDWVVIVTNPDGQNSLSGHNNPIQLIGLAITYDPAPTVTVIIPTTGINTTTVSITNLAGTNFKSGATVMLTPVNANPVHKGNLVDGTGGALLSEPRGVFVSGNYAYIASSGDNALEIVDVSNPAAPVHSGSLTHGSGGALLSNPRNVYISGNYAYVTSQNSSALEIVDVSNPAAPVHTGSLTNGSGGALLSVPRRIYISGNYAYITSGGIYALEIVDVSNPAAPVHMGSLTHGSGGALLSDPRGVYVSGNYAYVASSGSNALEIIDVSNPVTPVHKSSILHGAGGALLSVPNSVYVTGNYAYVTSSGSNALEIVDVSNPAAPVHAGSVTHGSGGVLLNNPSTIDVSGTYAYITSSGSNALEIVDVSNPAAPVHAGSVTHGSGGALLNNPNTVFVSGNYAYVTSVNSNALEIVDIGTITATDVNVVSANQITCTFNLTGKAPGPYNTVVTNPDGQFGMLTRGFTVTTTSSEPVADFIANVTSGTAPLPVSFTDLSVNDPTGWAWYFGDEDFTAPWTQVTAGAGWTGRRGHSSVAMPDGSIVLTGGNAGVGYKNDVWRSTDNGATWTQLPDAGWSARYGHSSVAMPDGSIVLMGGYDSGGWKNDTWHSTDNGATWTQVNASAGWTARRGHSSVAMPDGGIVLMGGYDGSLKNDVWRSTDNGATWTQLPNAGWLARAAHSSVAMPDGSIVLTGGNASGWKNDVWRSMDNGATWTQLPNAGWPVRTHHTTVAMPDGSIVLMGGWDGFSNKNDVWRSTDNGATWTQLPNAGWSGREGISSVAMPDGSIVLMGGNDASGIFKNDVWRFMSAGSLTQNPSHTYTTAGIYPVALQAYNANGYNSTRKTEYITVTEAKARAMFIASNFYWATTGTDAISSGEYSANVDINQAVWIPPDTSSGTITNLSVTLLAQNISNVNNRKYAVWNSTAVVWHYPSNMTISENSGIDSYTTTNLKSTQNVSVSLERFMNQTWFTGPGVQLIRVNVTFDTTDTPWINGNFMLKEYQRAPLNARILGETFLTDAPVQRIWTNNSYIFDFNLDKDQIRTGRPYQFAIAISLNPVNATPVQFKPYVSFKNNYINETREGENSVTAVTPPDMLPWLVNYSSATVFEPTHWTYQKVTSVGAQLEPVIAYSEEVPPVAGFTANVTTGTAPLIVQFNDTSTGSKTSWNWSFGDGNFSEVQNPVYAYTGPGTYTVTLEVFNSTGFDSRTKYNYIDVKMANQPPVAGFSISPDNPITSDTIAFTDTTSDPDGSIMAYAWTFGDGTTGTLKDPAHQYTTSGEYQVALTVTDDDGAMDTAIHLVIVNAPGTDTYTLDIPGMTVSEAHLGIDTNVAGSIVSTTGNTVTIDYNGLVITIGTSGITTENGLISGEITSINAQSDTITADLPTQGSVHASFNAAMNTLPAGAEIASVLTETITPEVQDAFELVATENGEEITDIAYIMEIAKTNLNDGTDIGAATVRMSASADWVTANGGPEKIRIIRYTAESGSEFLQPTWTIDDTGQYVFEVISPNGLSVFGLVASIMDDVPPTTILERTGTMGNNGWFVSDVTISLTGTDNEGGSGVGITGYSFDGTSWNTYSSPFTIIAEGTVTVFYNSTDNAGNIEETKLMTFSIDKTPPIISGAATTTPNTDGWYKSDVTVHFTATDLTSAVASVTPDVVLVTEGAGLTATGTATDNAGNSATSTVSGINLDTTQPQVTITIPFTGARYIQNEVVLADWSVNDALSGIALQSGTVPSGSAIDTTTIGMKTFVVTATDKAENGYTLSVSYNVQSPSQALQDMITYIESLNLPQGAGKSLTSKLGNAIDDMNRGNNIPAKNKLNSFMNEVQAQQCKKIPCDQGDILITIVQRIMKTIG